MSGKLGHLKPERLWTHFENICAIPRPSKHETAITAYLKNFGESLGLYTKVDEVGNVIMRKEATKGLENRKRVLLQSHIDMVPQKNNSTKHDFTKDPIKPYVCGDYVKAEGTTLGADNGIGIAAILALFESKDIPHGPLEALLTVDEEAGMGGVLGLKKGLLLSEIMLNLDSEAEGELFIGCAGGGDTHGKGTYLQESLKGSDYKAYTITINQARGGHSGIEIHLKRANANKLLARLLSLAAEESDIRIHSFEGGNLRNAIPREASAVVAIPSQADKRFQEMIRQFQANITLEYKLTDPDIKVTSQGSNLPEKAMTNVDTLRFLNMIMACAHGTKNMIPDMPEVSETSTNLAIIKVGAGVIEVQTMQRSSVESQKKEMMQTVKSCLQLGGLTVEHNSGYPGWAPNSNSPILKIASNLYEKMYHQKPKVMATHGGLECGLITATYPAIDALSFGPNIMGAHSPDEQAEIASVERFWDYLKEILLAIP